MAITTTPSITPKLEPAPLLTGDVLVIGAGPAGLASAYYLEQAGISYTVVETTDKVASTWADLYPSLRLNTATLVTYLPGRRMPLRNGWYATGRQLYDYLRQYGETHNFNIVFNCTVMRVAPDGEGYRVETTCGEACFRAVIVASGRFNNPYLPTFEGQSQFAGRILHARDYHRAADFAGERVMVVGNGPSGVDIALEIAEAAALPVFLSVRSDIVIARRYPFGLPDTAWVILAHLLVPKRWRQAFLNKVMYRGYKDAHDLGLQLAPNRTDRRGSSTPVRGRALIDAIHAGKIEPVVGVKRFHPHEVELSDGSCHAVDAVILSTGYRPAISYLDLPYETDRDGWPRRISDQIEGGSTQMLGYPGLHLVGRFYRGLGPLNNIRNEARIAVEEIRQMLKRQ